MKNLKLGCIKDPLDSRDYLMRAYLPLVKIPMRMDYFPRMSPVRDQGDEGTCVGFASACGMKEYQEQLDYGKLLILSPRYVYSECKKIDEMPDAEGTSVRIAMKVLKNKGVCLESYWPYNPHQNDKPKKGASQNAKRFCELSYARILDLNELRLSLATKGPCVVGIQAFAGIMKTKTGRVPMPQKGESSIGGHAVCAIGYDDQKKCVKFKNSWSTHWGEEGYGYLSYAYIEKYMMDAWSSVDIEDPNPLTIGKMTRSI